MVYFQSPKSFNAGLITALTNRVGDVLILLRIALIAAAYSWNFYVHSLSPCEAPRALPILLVAIAACTKRAQIPFSAWLPAAIAAPTPVSSLVHSSTLVTAGVYLLIRFGGLLPPAALNWLGLTGTCTIFLAGVSGLAEIDIKKIVALSTLRQLGLMVRALGIGA